MSRSSEISPVTLAWLRDAHPGIDDRFAAHESLSRTLGTVTFASSALTRLCIVNPAAIDVLSALDTRPTDTAGTVDSLEEWKQLELLRIAARDLIGVDSLEVVGSNLAWLADDVLKSALRIVGAPDDLAIIAMGKTAGRELNYASDIDIMFVGNANERVARDVMEIARRCFRTDADLRPEGRDGPLVRSIESYRTYWKQWAQTWEFQALLKSRAVAGPSEIQEQWSAAAQEALWSHAFGADELRELREMKARVETLVADKGLEDREVKRGRGGIRDVEFAVQLLQLVHGGHDETVRSRNTLRALEQLATGGYIAEDDASSLSDSYRFLRTVEHRLQLVELEQTHTLPTDRESRDKLATVLNFDNADGFEKEMRTCQANVRSAHERLYFRPLLEAFASDVVQPDAAMEERLSAFGFTDASRTRQAVKELTKGLARSSRLMQQLMPLLLDWLSQSPNPDEGLLGLRKLIAGLRNPTQITSVFRDSPRAAQRLCLLLGTSRLFGDWFSRHPEVIEDLGSSRSLRVEAPILERLQSAIEWRQTKDERLATLMRLALAERVRIAAADVLAMLDYDEPGKRRSDLADAVLQVALQELAPTVPIALIGMGRFGGREMSFASDLDVIVVHGGTTDEDQAAANDFASQLLQVLNSGVGGERPYALDYDLRPEGKNGALARSVDACRNYYNEWAQSWERQALVRARFVAGDPAVGAAFIDAVQPFVWDTTLSAEDLKEMRHLKARIEVERIPKGKDARLNLKLGPGSLSDVEWTAQLLQLQHSIPQTNTRQALELLTNVGALVAEDRQVLEESWRFCDLVRNRWYLVNGSIDDSLPVNPELFTFLARSLAVTAEELREHHLQVTRRARTATERLFYGKVEE